VKLTPGTPQQVSLLTLMHQAFAESIIQDLKYNAACPAKVMLLNLGNSDF
jgi:hypothetical protein